MHAAPYPEVDRDFGNWLAGFIDGEGCFSIFRGVAPRTGRAYYGCAFHIRLRDDDAAIIREIQRQTGFGVVSRQRAGGGRGRGSRAMLSWNASSRADCARLIAILDRYPLRAKKARDFAIWREAVDAWIAKGGRKVRPGRGGAGFQPHDWTDMKLLMRELREVRAYGPLPPEPPSASPPALF